MHLVLSVNPNDAGDVEAYGPYASTADAERVVTETSRVLDSRIRFGIAVKSDTEIGMRGSETSQPDTLESGHFVIVVADVNDPAENIDVYGSYASEDAAAPALAGARKTFPHGAITCIEVRHDRRLVFQIED